MGNAEYMGRRLTTSSVSTVSPVWPTAVLVVSLALVLGCSARAVLLPLPATTSSTTLLTGLRTTTLRTPCSARSSGTTPHPWALNLSVLTAASRTAPPTRAVTPPSHLPGAASSSRTGRSALVLSAARTAASLKWSLDGQSSVWL